MSPKSTWYSTPNSRRRRREIKLTLAAATLVALERLAEVRGVSRSRIIDELLTEYVAAHDLHKNPSK